MGRVPARDHERDLRHVVRVVLQRIRSDRVPGARPGDARGVQLVARHRHRHRARLVDARIGWRQVDAPPPKALDPSRHYCTLFQYANVPAQAHVLEDRGPDGDADRTQVRLAEEQHHRARLASVWPMSERTAFLSPASRRTSSGSWLQPSTPPRPSSNRACAVTNQTFPDRRTCDPCVAPIELQGMAASPYFFGTRRSLPFGGPGIVEIMLAFVLTRRDVPFAPAAAGVVAHRHFNFWARTPPRGGRPAPHAPRRTADRALAG